MASRKAGKVPSSWDAASEWRREYKKALREISGDLGYRGASKVPKHVRAALRSHADHLAQSRLAKKVVRRRRKRR